MKEFTITNVFKCWLKLWPVTIILLILGFGAGIFAIKQTEPSYTAELDVLILDNKDGSSAVEYAGLVDSDLVSEPVFKEAAVDDNCKIAGSGKGDVLAFNATCPTSEEALHLVTIAAKNFDAWAKDIYGAENFRTVQLSKEAFIAKSFGSGKKINTLAVPMAVMLILSFVIAFVQLDYKVSKNNDKKA